jgi:hypothetical protein
MLPTMHSPEITTHLTRPNFFERLTGQRRAYETKITNGVIEVVGRGPTPEDSHEAAQTRWDFAQLTSSVMLP